MQLFVLRTLAMSSKPGSVCTGRKGAVELPNAVFKQGWAATSEACMRACADCGLCTFFSVSLHFQDCSWYSSCAGEIPGATPPMLANMGNYGWFRTYEMSGCRNASKAQFEAAQRYGGGGKDDERC